MDLVTVADFAVGAMENWGLVTYRSALLIMSLCIHDLLFYDGSRDLQVYTTNLN